MPELPEVEVLVRHLGPLLKNQTVKGVDIRRAKVLHPTPEPVFRATLLAAEFVGLSRRGKYLIFTLRRSGNRTATRLIGHLGMTGRMYLQPAKQPLPKHAAVILNLGRMNFVFEDTRYFGRLTLDAAPLTRLGPEPFADGFSVPYLAQVFKRSRQSVKVKLLDQSLVAGIGNIYANEALYRARISPRLAVNKLTRIQLGRLLRAVRMVLTEAIEFGSTVPLNWAGAGERDGLFYYGRAEDAADFYAERLRVYDREGQPCPRCAKPIKRAVMAARSTYYCSNCQRS